MMIYLKMITIKLDKYIKDKNEKNIKSQKLVSSKTLPPAAFQND